MAASRPRRPALPRGTDFTAPLCPIEQAELVRELDPQVALPLWQVLRSVLQWASEAPALRGDLFEPCAMADWERQLLEEPWAPEVRQPLAVAVGELSRPGPSTPETIAYTCMCVTDWALEHSHTSTALAYAEAAALACPESPRYAWTAGRLLCAHGRPREGENWLKRAKDVAARAKDGEAQALALTALGNLHYEKGDGARAWRVLTDALRVARKHGLHERGGEILHDLSVVAFWTGDLETAERLACESYEVYRGGHPRLPALAHDLAAVWMERGQAARALHILRELASHVVDSVHARGHALASLARAAAACGDDALFDAASADAWAIGQEYGWTAHAFMEVGLGATSLRRWDQAEFMLRRAYEVTVEAANPEIRKRAEAALEAVALRRVADRERDTMDSLADDPADPLVAGILNSLILNSLRGA